MLTTDDVFETGPLPYAAAEHLADRWNTAYPVMRAVATRYIEATRQAIKDEVWKVDETTANAVVLRSLMATEPELRRKLKRTEDLRRELGRLDRAEYKGCTRSPGSFSITGAYMGVRSLLNISSLGTAGMSPVYLLAAALADAEDALNQARAARH